MSFADRIEAQDAGGDKVGRLGARIVGPYLAQVLLDNYVQIQIGSAVFEETKQSVFLKYINL